MWFFGLRVGCRGLQGFCGLGFQGFSARVRDPWGWDFQHSDVVVALSVGG